MLYTFISTLEIFVYVLLNRQVGFNILKLKQTQCESRSKSLQSASCPRYPWQVTLLSHLSGSRSYEGKVTLFSLEYLIGINVVPWC